MPEWGTTKDENLPASYIPTLAGGGKAGSYFHISVLRALGVMNVSNGKLLSDL